VTGTFWSDRKKGKKGDWHLLERLSVANSGAFDRRLVSLPNHRHRSQKGDWHLLPFGATVGCWQRRLRQAAGEPAEPQAPISKKVTGTFSFCLLERLSVAGSGAFRYLNTAPVDAELTCFA
jgi:hypothetical protein